MQIELNRKKGKLFTALLRHPRIVLPIKRSANRFAKFVLNEAANGVLSRNYVLFRHSSSTTLFGASVVRQMPSPDLPLQYMSAVYSVCSRHFVLRQQCGVENSTVLLLKLPVCFRKLLRIYDFLFRRYLLASVYFYHTL